jgi:hypothetical protein
MMPLTDAARVLLNEGVALETKLVMRHAAGDHDALTTSVGAAAHLALQEGDRTPVLRPWRPSPHAAVEPPSRENEAPATLPAA